MEPVTHILTGTCLARCGLNRRAAYATVVMAAAAEFPDIDTLWGLGGPVTGFQHHRGITHTFLGVPLEAALLVAAAWLVHRWRVRRAARTHPAAEPGHAVAPHPLTAAPVRWGRLYVFALVALLSHLLLDFTNNYGLRPFFPFNPRWYAASITFIFDPWMFLALLGALVLPLLFRLIGSEIGSRRQPFPARGWSMVALAFVVALWTLRATQHDRAEAIAEAQTLAAPSTAAVQAPGAPLEPPPVPAPLENAQAGLASASAGDFAPAPDASAPVYLQPQRVLASPDPFNPFRWFTVIDFGPLYQLGEADTRAGTYRAGQQPTTKPAPGPALQAAAGSPLGRAYFDWSPMPFVSVEHDAPGTSDSDLPAGHTLVIFRDPRFMGDVPWMRNRTPLQGTVELDMDERVVRQTMDGKPQR